jgi:hypothetical protein
VHATRTKPGVHNAGNDRMEKHGTKLHFVRIAGVQLLLCTHTRWVYLHSSGTSVPHLNLSGIHDEWHLAFSTRQLKHLLEPCIVFFHIIIRCLISIGRPGLIGIGSTCLAIDDNDIRHK